MTVQTEYDEGLGLFAGRIPLTMGTRMEFLCTDVPREQAERVWEEIARRTDDLSRMLNRFDPGSEVSRWNAGRSEGKMSKDLQAILEAAEVMRGRTGGLFDVCYGWHGRMAGSHSPAGRGTLEDLFHRKLDFGGIAKGWALREAGEFLEKEGIENAWLDFGGSSILARGRHPGGDCWKVSFPNPWAGDPRSRSVWTGDTLDVFSLRDSSLSTSGNRPGYSGHIVNPLTGAAEDSPKLVSVISPDPLEAEVLSTAAMIADEGQLQQLRKAFPTAKINLYRP